ncbi:MAG: aspartyl protease family protein [Pyrinomonadaceae bacterium]
MRKFVSAIPLALVATTLWAVPSDGAAHLFSGWGRRLSRFVSPLSSSRPAQRGGQSENPRTIPAPARFRESESRGLLVKVWVNDAGAYTFALDTGAGASIISPRVAREAGVGVAVNRNVNVSGLSGRNGSGREAVVRTLAIEDRSNYLPSKGLIIISDGLPPDLDGVLDPSECYWPLGYVINFQAEEIAAFDSRREPLRSSDAPPDGAIVRWLTDGNSRRPFVVLEGGRRALIDTGSGFGLALNASAARAFGVNASDGRERGSVRDLGGGHVSARRVEPLTVKLGPLVLRRVPTDILSGAAADAPILLGRDALRPFQLTFDPLNRLICFAPR